MIPFLVTKILLQLTVYDLRAGDDKLFLLKLSCIVSNERNWKVGEGVWILPELVVFCIVKLKTRQAGCCAVGGTRGTFIEIVRLLKEEDSSGSRDSGSC